MVLAGYISAGGDESTAGTRREYAGGAGLPAASDQGEKAKTGPDARGGYRPGQIPAGSVAGFAFLPMARREADLCSRVLSFYQNLLNKNGDLRYASPHFLCLKCCPHVAQ